MVRIYSMCLFVYRYEYTPPKDLHVTEEQETKKTNWVPRFKRDLDEIHRQKRAAFDPKAHDRMMDIIQHKESINADNCMTFTAEELELEGKSSLLAALSGWFHRLLP